MNSVEFLCCRRRCRLWRAPVPSTAHSTKQPTHSCKSTPCNRKISRRCHELYRRLAFSGSWFLSRFVQPGIPTSSSYCQPFTFNPPFAISKLELAQPSSFSSSPSIFSSAASWSVACFSKFPAALDGRLESVPFVPVDGFVTSPLELAKQSKRTPTISSSTWPQSCRRLCPQSGSHKVGQYSSFVEGAPAEVLGWSSAHTADSRGS